jgi:lipopolysaccharide export system permease protein
MLFDSTIRRELARSFSATLVVVLTIVLTMFLIRTLGQAAGGRIAPQDVVLYLGYTALGQLPTMLALSLFISVVATLGRMYRDSEMTIWFSSGISLSRFVRPVLRMAWPILLVVAVLALLVWPWVNQRSVELRDRYDQRSDLSRVAPGQFQSSSDGKKVFFIERDGADGVTGRNVFILTTDDEKESITTAERGRIEIVGDERFLVLENGQRNEENLTTGERTIARFNTYRVLAGEAVLRNTSNLPPKAQTTWQLMINPIAAHKGELVWRLGLVLAAANMLLLGTVLSASNPRRASNWNLLLALLAFIVYYNLINLSNAWVAADKLTMGESIFAVHGFTLFIALVVLWWRDHATSFGGPRRLVGGRS